MIEDRIYILKKRGLFKRKLLLKVIQGCSRFQFSAHCQYRTLTSVVE